MTYRCAYHISMTVKQFIEFDADVEDSKSQSNENLFELLHACCLTTTVAVTMIIFFFISYDLEALVSSLLR